MRREPRAESRTEYGTTFRRQGTGNEYRRDRRSTDRERAEASVERRLAAGNRLQGAQGQRAARSSGNRPQGAQRQRAAQTFEGRKRAPYRKEEWRPAGRTRSYREERGYYERSLKEHRYKEPEEFRDLRGRRFLSQEAEKGRKKKKKGKAKRAFTVILCILLVLLIGLGVIWAVPSYRAVAVKTVLKSPFGPMIGRMIIGDSYEKYVRDKNFDESEIVIHDGVSVPDGNVTIALFGVDARAEDLTIGTMADSMVVVNVDSEGNIKMASIFRDSYLLSRTQDGEEIISKANSAYFRGGPAGAVNMLNENFDLAITDYVVVNFWGLSNIIDLLGGLRLKVTEEEMNALNYHMYEQNLYGGTEYTPLETFGDSVLLNGDQATAFCRLRSVDFDSPVDGITYTDDYGRTARQRYALTELLAQTREQGVLKLMRVADKLFKANSGDRKFIQTSMDVKELVKLFIMGYEMNMAGSEGFPALDHQYNALLDSGDCVVADTLEENVTLLHRFLYGIEGYEPTNELLNIAERIRDEVARQIGY